MKTLRGLVTAFVYVSISPPSDWLLPSPPLTFATATPIRPSTSATGTVTSSAMRRNMITELSLEHHHTTFCNPDIVGSEEACFDPHIHAIGCDDYPIDAPEVAIPEGGLPWGVHITPPADKEGSYIFSWNMGTPTVNPPQDAVQELTNVSGVIGWVRLGRGAHASREPSSQLDCAPDSPRAYLGASDPRFVPHVDEAGPGACYDTELPSKVVTYLREYNATELESYSYVSAHLHHAEVASLLPNATYRYRVGNGTHWSKEFTFNTLPQAAAYPFKLGLIADVGQTLNSSTTRDRLIESAPHLVLNVGDLSYADQYSPSGADVRGRGTNQRRWDSFQVLWERALAQFPTVHAAGNHEIEEFGIAAVLTPDTSSFRAPQNFPFQAYSARFPRPGQANFGDISSNLYHYTTAGPVAVINLCNYIPFHAGTPQHDWFLRTIGAVDRAAHPWLLVMVHAPIYHTYAAHYKEMECFRSVYEALFARHAVDIVLSGHVHAYERTHPVLDYQPNWCGPAYVTIGDGGNVEGPYRNFVDQVAPEWLLDKVGVDRAKHPNVTYCEMAPSPNAMQPSEQGPPYQRQIHPPSCNTLSFQPPHGVAGGQGLVPHQDGPSLFWCQSSQPDWSAHRDPSFGHATLTILSATEAKIQWHRNVDPPGSPPADTAKYVRQAPGLLPCDGAWLPQQYRSHGDEGRNKQQEEDQEETLHEVHQNKKGLSKEFLWMAVAIMEGLLIVGLVVGIVVVWSRRTQRQFGRLQAYWESMEADTDADELTAGL